MSEYLAENNSEALLFTGLADALVGVVEGAQGGPLAVYDPEKIIQIFMDRDGMDYGDAVDFFYYNTYSAWMGPGTPRFLFKISNFCGEVLPRDEE